MKLWLVYLITNLLNLKVYVGITNKTLQKRWSAHKAQARHGSHYHFHRALRKYPETAWKLEVLEPDLPEETAKKAEVAWIAKLDSFNPLCGYNCTLGGDGFSRPYQPRGPHSEETRQKIGLAHLGSKASEDARLNMRNAHLGVPLSEAHSKAIRDGKAGKTYKHTEETKAKIKATKAQNPYRHTEEAKAKMKQKAKERWAKKRLQLLEEGSNAI